MILGIADDFDATTISPNFLALGNVVARIVRALGLHVGMELGNQSAHIRLVENYDSIDIGEGCENFRAFAGRHGRPAFALKATHTVIGVDGDNKLATQRPRAAQIPDVPDMQQIEAAVGQDDLLAAAPPLVYAIT